MGIIAVIVCLFCLFISYKKLEYEKINPISFFYFLWLIILFLSVLNFYDIKKPSNLAYLLIMLMLIGFLIGTLIFYNVSKILKNNKSKISKKKKSNFLLINLEQKKIIYIMFVVSILVSIFDIIIIIKCLLLEVPMWQIRNWTLEPFGSNNPIISRRTFLEELFRTIIISPFNLIAPAISAYVLFNEKRKEKYKLFFSILSLITLLLNCIASGGGRLNIICFVGFYFLAFFYSKEKIEINLNKIKKYFNIVVSFGLILTILLSALRNGFGGFIKECYRYFAMSPTLLSEWLPQIINTNHTYGLLTFFGFHGYIFRGLNFIGMDFLVPEIYNLSYNAILNAEIFIDIGGGVANAFVTPIYYFMIDGGITFVCFASIFFGYTISYFYERIIKNYCIKNFIYYALIMYAIFISFMRIQTCIPSFIITIILVYLLFNKRIMKG